jgi:hypothetical protein
MKMLGGPSGIARTRALRDAALVAPPWWPSAAPGERFGDRRAVFLEGGRRAVALALIRSRARRDLKPNREQRPNTKDHQEGDETYRQHLPYLGDSWLDGFSYHLPTPA